MIRQAVILAGGLGTRLGRLTQTTPKPLLHVAGRPFLLWLLDEVRRSGYDDVIVSAGYKSEQVRDVATEEAGVSVVSEPTPLGTAGALRYMADRLDERFLLLNGDSLFNIDLRQFADRHSTEVLATLALRWVSDASRYGKVQLDGDRVTLFEEKSQFAEGGLINGGVAVIDRKLIADAPIDTVVSIERDFYPEAALVGRVAGFVFDGVFIDIGTPEDYLRAQTVVPEALAGRGAPVARPSN